MTFSQWDLPILSDANLYSNFQCFVESVTPKVPSKKLPKARTPTLNGVTQPISQETVQSFSLSTLWDLYTDQSIYGTGVPLLLSTGESVVQYYCPSLSAIQIFTEKPSSPIRLLGKSCVVKQDISSCSDESETDELSMSLSNNSSKSWDFASDDSNNEHDGLCTMIESFGEFYCQYNETLSPYQRVPLREKINQLAKEYPGLLKFHSTDLSPYSWFAIAWYPIYQIPLTKNVKELAACFVTYHSLSSFKGTVKLAPEEDLYHKFPTFSPLGKYRLSPCFGFPKDDKVDTEESNVTIPPFGVATYKMNGNLWTNPSTSDKEKIASCLNAACSWLKLVNFWHHDFSFFMSRRSF